MFNSSQINLFHVYNDLESINNVAILIPSYFTEVIVFPFWGGGERAVMKKVMHKFKLRRNTAKNQSFGIW